MRYDNTKQLKQKIKQLKEENEFLQKGIDTREDAHDYVCKQRDTQMAVTQKLVYMLLFMEVIEDLIKNDYTTVSKTIKRAINKFKQELTDGFSQDHLILNLNDKLDNDITL